MGRNLEDNELNYTFFLYNLMALDICTGELTSIRGDSLHGELDSVLHGRGEDTRALGTQLRKSISCSSHCRGNSSDSSDLSSKSLAWPPSSSLQWREVWWQEHEVAGHLRPPQGSQE